jgi:hypothetical protein
MGPGRHAIAARSVRSVDVDVLVIGTADLDDLEEAARRCEPALGREVNIRRNRRQFPESV